MIINRTTDYMGYRDAHSPLPERGPKYIRIKKGPEQGTDIIEISDAGRRLLREKNASPLAKAGLLISDGIGALIQAAEQEIEIQRKQALGELRVRVRNGSYDFDQADRVAAAAEIIRSLIR